MSENENNIVDQDGPLTKKDENFVEVVVLTTSGSYPITGYDRVPSHQKVRIELEKAKKVLKIVDTNDWIALVNGSEIEIDRSYLENQLQGQINIDWGPPQGGGGFSR